MLGFEIFKVTSGSILNVGFVEVLRTLCPRGDLLHTVASRLSNNGILWRRSLALGYAERHVSYSSLSSSWFLRTVLGWLCLLALQYMLWQTQLTY